MGLAAVHQRLLIECGGVNNAKKCGELSNAVKALVGDSEFNKNYNVYQEACQLLCRDKNSTAEDVVKMVKTARENSKNNAEATEMLRLTKHTISNYINLFKVKNFPASEMEKLVEIASKWKTNPQRGFTSFDDYAADYISKYAKNGNTSNNEPEIPMQKMTLARPQSTLTSKYLDALAERQLIESKKQLIEENIQKSFDFFK